MRTSRRSVLAAAILGLAGCTDSDSTGSLDQERRPERPSSLTRENVASYLRAYETAYMIHEGIDRSQFETPDEAVSMDCRTQVEADGAGAYVGLVQCSGTIEPDLGEPVEFAWGIAGSPLYFVTADTTRRIDPEVEDHGPPDDGAETTAGPETALSIANFSDAERDVAVDVDVGDGEAYRTERTVQADGGTGIEGIAPPSTTLAATVSVDGEEIATVEPSVDDAGVFGVVVFVGPDGTATVTTASSANAPASGAE